MTRTGNEPESAECRRGVVHGVCVYTSKAMAVVRHATSRRWAEIKIHGEKAKGIQRIHERCRCRKDPREIWQMPRRVGSAPSCTRRLQVDRNGGREDKRQPRTSGSVMRLDGHEHSTDGRALSNRDLVERGGAIILPLHGGRRDLVPHTMYYVYIASNHARCHRPCYWP